MAVQVYIAYSKMNEIDEFTGSALSVLVPHQFSTLGRAVISCCI